MDWPRRWAQPRRSASHCRTRFATKNIAQCVDETSGAALFGFGFGMTLHLLRLSEGLGVTGASQNNEAILRSPSDQGRSGGVRFVLIPAFEVTLAFKECLELPIRVTLTEERLNRFHVLRQFRFDERHDKASPEIKIVLVRHGDVTRAVVNVLRAFFSEVAIPRFEEDFCCLATQKGFVLIGRPRRRPLESRLQRVIGDCNRCGWNLGHGLILITRGQAVRIDERER